MTKISELIDLEPVDEVNLKVAGVAYVEELLEGFSNKRARKKLSKATGIAEKKLEAWVIQADFLRIKGIGPNYALLLQETGLAGIKDLISLDAQEFYEKLGQLNEEKELVQALPSVSLLEDWIGQAGQLE